MTEPFAFALAVLAVLATPGPTNTLLATSGAAAGFIRSIHLIFAEMLGYLISIIALSLVIGPLVQASHVLSLVLRVACGLFLFYAAWKLWREGGIAVASDQPVSFRRVLIATMLNPKGVIFAFVIVPYLTPQTATQAAPYMAALLAFICMAGGGWVGAGALLRAGVNQGRGAGAVRRVGALVLCAFATLISASALSG